MIPRNGNDIVLTSWAMTENKFATIDPKTGVVPVTKVGSRENDDKATVTVRLQLSSGKVLEATKEVYFYAYKAKLGDYIFADGSYGADLSFSDSSPIGIIFYIEPKVREWAVAGALSDYISNVAWGLCNNTDNSSLPNITLANMPSYPVYDIPSIDNVPIGVNITDTNMRDESNTENDGFKEYAQGYSVSDLGFVEVTAKIWNSNIGSAAFGEYLGKAGVAIGDKVSRGFLNSLYIMAHRNFILQDPNINLPIPKTSETETLAENLKKCILAVQQSHNSALKYQQYYYPAASYCNAYVPNVKDKLVDKFGEGRWSLPSAGELSRIAWYHMQNGSDKNANNIFAQGRADFRFIKMENTSYWSSSEQSDAKAWTVNPISGAVGHYEQNLKHIYIAVRPVISFKL